MSTPPPAQPLAVHRSRPVESNWQCKKSGECCTQTHGVVMTPEEMRAIRLYVAARPELSGIQALGVARGDGMMVMDANPCPFFLFNSCAVYAVRPYNCRRFACMRPNPATEPLEWDDTDPMGCKNLSERVLHSKDARSRYRHIQRRAQEWARQHGWNP